MERKGKVIPCIGAEVRKGARTDSERPGMRNLEAESIRSRAERMGGCVKLKIVTDVRQGSACDTFKWQTLFILY